MAKQIEGPSGINEEGDGVSWESSNGWCCL